MSVFRSGFAAIGFIFVRLPSRAIAAIGSLGMKRVDRMSGIRFEHYVARLLKKNRFSAVTVTQTSGDFGVDITARRDGNLYAVQCKHYGANVGVSAVQEVYSGAAKYGATIAAVITNSHYTPGAKKLSESLGVLLWDREELIALRRRKRKRGYKSTDAKKFASITVTEVYSPTTLEPTDERGKRK